MTGSHENFSPENSGNRAIILAPHGFDGDCLRFYATLAIETDASRQIHLRKKLALK
jgi:hypothetical protein